MAGPKDSRQLLACADYSRVVLRHSDGLLTERELLRRASRIAPLLPRHSHVINLCETRAAFLLAFVAALIRRQTTLLPASRAAQAIEAVEGLHADSYRCDDAFIRAAEAGAATLVVDEHALFELKSIEPDFPAAIGFTSGSTGTPQANLKRWRAFVNSARVNEAAMRNAATTLAAAPTATVVATVPSQHMYGMELSVVLPLLGGMAISPAKPLFAAEIAAALAHAPEPRVLVSTPIHLRVLLESTLQLPRLALIVSATAPLDQALAMQLEQRLDAPLLEMFGATETMVIAARRTAVALPWQPYPEVVLTPSPEHTTVQTPWFDSPQQLLDQIELQTDGRFLLRGRSADLIEIAGKRGSLGELTRRLLDIDGVEDAVVIQPGDEQARLRRVAALVVAPTLTQQAILAALATSVDAVFLPRPLYIVRELPRNAVGKLPRAAVLEALDRAAQTARSP